MEEDFIDFNVENVSMGNVLMGKHISLDEIRAGGSPEPTEISQLGSEFAAQWGEFTKGGRRREETETSPPTRTGLLGGVDHTKGHMANTHGHRGKSNGHSRSTSAEGVTGQQQSDGLSVRSASGDCPLGYILVVLILLSLSLRIVMTLYCYYYVL
jgi:hypothetical protein